MWSVGQSVTVVSPTETAEPTEMPFGFVFFGQGFSLLWTHTLRPFYSRPIALTQEGRNLVDDVCECVRD